MISVLLASSVWALGTGLGALVAAPMGRGRWTRTETTLFSAAIGLGGIAYAVFAIGLVGSLNRTALAVLGAAAAVPACVGLLSLLRYRHETQPAERSTRGGAWFAASAAVILAVTACAALLDCFVPPGAHEWDSLSYHLATPQAYLRAGRIVELPTDHHSYFPFLTQMLFTVGLMFDGFATAKLIHFMFGAMACMAAYAMARRLTSATGAWLAALVFGLAPMVVWEAGIAYIELAQTFFVTLALHALLIWARSRDQRDLAACGACCGLALAVKTLSLLPVVGVVVAALVTEPRAHRALALVGVTALVGSPFYIRTWLLTGNPVYPFAYGVFGGRNWDAERARAYASEHTSFGLNAALPALSDDLRPTRAAYARPSMSDRLRNLALAPFALVASPRIFHNYNDPTPYASLGFLWLALLPLAVLGGARDPAALMLAGILAVWYLAWSGSMQYMRYLIPALPALAAVGASGAIRLGRRSGPVRWAVIAAVAVQVIVLWGHAIPRAAAQAPLAWSPDLAETFLSRRMNVYESQRRLRAITQVNDGVVLFEETRGYYLDRPVLWGNSPHSAFIPYESFRTAGDMVQWFVSRGFRYALLNLQFAPQAGTPDGASELRAAVAAGAEEDLVLRWYMRDYGGSDPWRSLIGEAVRSGQAVILRDATTNAVVAMRFVHRGEVRP